MRLAPPAGTEPGLFGRDTLVEENHLGAARSARRTGGTAINSGRTNRINEAAVKTYIPVDDGIPEFLPAVHPASNDRKHKVGEDLCAIRILLSKLHV